MDVVKVVKSNRQSNVACSFGFNDTCKNVSCTCGVVFGKHSSVFCDTPDGVVV